MPLKRNKSGRLQAYDPRTGRYSHMTQADFETLLGFNKVKNKIPKKDRLYNSLYAKAHNSKDPLVTEVFDILEQIFPYCVRDVNSHRFDKNINKYREFDIITSKTIIEVKSGAATHRAKQLLGQKRFAEERQKAHIVYAPNISRATKIEYNKIGLCITSSVSELINAVRRYEK